jgi:hypothetical protein
VASVRPAGRGVLETSVVLSLLACAVSLAVWFVGRNGWTLYYGDAEAHLDIARRILDSRTPGYSQIGTVWLPLPHLLMLPFVANDAWWRSGMAGAIPAAVCFVAAGVFLFGAVRTLSGSASVACAALGVFALNPNVLYLSSIPMTEPVFFASVFGMLWAMARLGKGGSLRAAALGGLAALAASLTRYEGWFLIPFAALFFLIAAPRRRFLAAIVFTAIACAGPLWWLAHNRFYFGDAFAFFHGPGSAKDIYQRALDAGMARYPGDHDWLQAAHYFGSAIVAVCGPGAVVFAILGLFGAPRKGLLWAAGFLALPPVFYVLSMHSSGTPIFLPTLWPFSYYNTRYGLAALPLLAFCAGACTLVFPTRHRKAAAVAVVTLAALALAVRPVKSLCWKESEVNSDARRAWVGKAAHILSAGYRPGAGILRGPNGDLTAILREAGIPLRESLNDGNGPAYAAALSNPRFFLHEEWVIAISGDAAATAVQRCYRSGPRYERVALFAEKDSPVVEIYRKD